VPPDEPFTAILPQGRAWIAPQQDAWNVCNEIAIFTPDHRLLADLSRCYPWYLPGCPHQAEAHQRLLQRRTAWPPLTRLPGRVAILSALSGHIYYHWMFDLLPRVAILQQHLQHQGQTLQAIDYFVVNNLNHPFQRETLTTLGIPLDQVITSDQHPHLQADQLWVPSFAGPLDWVPPSSLDFLRQRFLPQTPSPPTPPLPRRLYISRDQARYRHVLNQAAVLETLKPLGFKPIQLETLSVAEQVQLFAQADVIVSPHGSGLTNLAFCQPGTVVVECFSPHYLRTDYWMISQYLELHHYYLVGQTITCGPLRQLMYPSGLTEDFTIDLESLRRVLKAAGVRE
jgi:capsular polysaccharide biosynthesis protein